MNIEQLSLLWKRIKVILRAALTWITLAVVVIQFVLAQDVLLDYPEAVEWGGRIVTFLLGVVAMIRQVTPVPKDQRGLL